MNNKCTKWHNALLEAALIADASATPEFAVHLRDCGDCRAGLAALRLRREQMDALLPLVARAAQPSAGFGSRVMAATEVAGERKRAPAWRLWVVAAATIVLLAALVTSRSMLYPRPSPAVADGSELAAAQKLAEWHAPSDVLLATPGRQILRGSPNLGHSYLKLAARQP